MSEKPHPDRKIQVVDREKHKQILHDVSEGDRDFILIYEHIDTDGKRYWAVASNVRRDEAAQVLTDISTTLGTMLQKG